MNQRVKNLKPLARKEGLVIQELPDELLVYDLDSKHKSGKKDEKNPKEKKDKLTVTRLPKPNEHQSQILDALRVPLPAK